MQNLNQQRMASQKSCLNIIQKPLKTECSPKNYSNNSFKLSSTQPLMMETKRKSIDSTSTSRRIIQSNKRNINYSNNQKENINFTSQFSNSLTPNNRKGRQIIPYKNTNENLLNNSQHSIQNTTSGSNLYSSRLQTHQFEQKLLQQRDKNQQLIPTPAQLKLQNYKFNDTSKGDLQLSQINSPSSHAILTSSRRSSQSKERILSLANLSEINCKYHNYHQASFYSIENRVISYFCSSCSVDLIKKGIRIHEITNSQLSTKSPFQQQILNQTQNTKSTNDAKNPMKLSQGQHLVINLSKQSDNQNDITQLNQSTIINNSSKTSIMAPVQKYQSVTLPMSIFDPIQNQNFPQNQNQNIDQTKKQINNLMVIEQNVQQAPSLNRMGNQYNKVYEEPFEVILARNNIQGNDLLGEKGQLKQCLEDLLKKVENVKGFCYEKLQTLDNKKCELNELYELQKQIVQQKMLEIVRQLEEQKQSSLKKIQKQKNDSAQFLEIETAIKHYIKDINNIQADIKDNISNIFQNLELQSFKIIYNKYNSKLESFLNYIRSIENSPISYSLLNPHQISTYHQQLVNQFSQAFKLYQNQNVISHNLLKDIQMLIPSLEEVNTNNIDVLLQKKDEQLFNHRDCLQNSKEAHQDSYNQGITDFNKDSLILEDKKTVSENNNDSYIKNNKDNLIHYQNDGIKRYNNNKYFVKNNNDEQVSNNSHKQLIPFKSYLNNLSEKQTSRDISQEETLRNKWKKIQQNNNEFKDKNSCQDQVYVSFNNKNIFKNELNQQIETLNDEQNQECIPLISLDMSSTKKYNDDEDGSNLHPSLQQKLKIQKLIREESDESDKDNCNFSAKDDEDNSKHNSSMHIKFVDSQIENIVKSNAGNSTNSFNSKHRCIITSDYTNFENNKKENNQMSNINMDIAYSNLDQYKHNPIIKQISSPSRNSQNSGKGRNTSKSPYSSKYLNMLDKININQLNTNIFYQTLIKDNQIQSSCSDSNSQKQSISTTNTFSHQLQKLQTNADSNQSSSHHYNQQYNILTQPNSSINILPNQNIFSDEIQGNQNIKSILPKSPLNAETDYLYTIPVSGYESTKHFSNLTSSANHNMQPTQPLLQQQQLQAHQQQYSSQNYQKILF